MLSGARASIYSGIAIIDSSTGKRTVDSELTKVSFKPIPEGELGAYIRTGEPLGKAGAIAVQGRGARFVQRYADILDEMVAGVAAYAEDVRTRRYPGPDHAHTIPDEELAAFRAAMASSAR